MYRVVLCCIHRCVWIAEWVSKWVYIYIYFRMVSVSFWRFCRLCLLYYTMYMLRCSCFGSSYSLLVFFLCHCNLCMSCVLWWCSLAPVWNIHISDAREQMLFLSPPFIVHISPKILSMWNNGKLWMENCECEKSQHGIRCWAFSESHMYMNIYRGNTNNQIGDDYLRYIEIKWERASFFFSSTISLWHLTERHEEHDTHTLTREGEVEKKSETHKHTHTEFRFI